MNVEKRLFLDTALLRIAKLMELNISIFYFKIHLTCQYLPSLKHRLSTQKLTLFFNKQNSQMKVNMKSFFQ